MSRYNGFDYGRGPPPRDRSRSPARFSADRRQSSVGGGSGNFDARPAPGPHRGGPGPDTPRGARPAGGPNAAPPRTLREAPPLSSGGGGGSGPGGDRGRPFRERDDYRRPSPPPLPRNRSPPRNARDPRDFPPPRDLDTARARRSSRDGPLSAGSNFSDGASFAPAPRGGGYARGRARGDFEYRPGRGGRRLVDDRDRDRERERDLRDRDRDLYLRDRSPPPRYGRDLSRDSRDADRWDDRAPRFDRRVDDDRRGDWSDRERDDPRGRREPPMSSLPPSAGGPGPGRGLEPRGSAESLSGGGPGPAGSGSATTAAAPSGAALPINPERLALIESSTSGGSAPPHPNAESPLRRSSVAPSAAGAASSASRPEQVPDYLNGRKETLQSRYGSRGSSPPTQAPPVPAFSFAMPSAAPVTTPAPAPASAASVNASVTATAAASAKAAPDAKALEVKVESKGDSKPVAGEASATTTTEAKAVEAKAGAEEKVPAPPSAPATSTTGASVPASTTAAARVASPVPASTSTAAAAAAPPPNAPAAPRAERVGSAETSSEQQPAPPTGPRLQHVRSAESLGARSSPDVSTTTQQQSQSQQLGPPPASPLAPRQTLSHLNKPLSPNPPPQTSRFGDIIAPTGPKASRPPPASSPKPPFTSSPRVGDAASPPPPSAPPMAPLGPRRQSFSVSPKISHQAGIPTGPKGPRGGSAGSVGGGSGPPPLAPRAPAAASGASGPAGPGGAVAGSAGAQGQGQAQAQGQQSQGSLGSRPERPPFAPPSGPRNLQWNQWRRPPPSGPGGLQQSGFGPGGPQPPSGPQGSSSNLPMKRGFDGEEKFSGSRVKHEDDLRDRDRDRGDAMEIDSNDVATMAAATSAAMARRRSSGYQQQQQQAEGGAAHSAARSFFGQTKGPVPGASESSDADDAEDDEDDEDEDEDDELLDDDEDQTLLEAKHARAERELAAQKADLSLPRYRATSPLESIARLARISVRDLEKVAERERREGEEVAAQEKRERDRREKEEEKKRASAAAAAAASEERAASVSTTTTTMTTGKRKSRRDRLAPPASNATAAADADSGILTPKGEDAGDAKAKSSVPAPPAIKRVRRPTPEAIELPYLLKSEDGTTLEAPEIQELEVFQENLSALEQDEEKLFAVLNEDLKAEDEAELDAEEDFRRFYRRWKDECAELDRVREEQEKLERQMSAEPGMVGGPGGLLESDGILGMPVPGFGGSAGGATPTIEGGSSSSRRVHKFSSEYEIEQVLKQSEETARLEREKLEREDLKNRADLLKEAHIPDQCSVACYPDRAPRLIDANRLRAPDALTLVFGYEPPPDDFDENEQAIFIAAFKDTPKKWGEIASLLPGRTYRDCIQHYYANKWDGRFRDNRAKKLKGGRRGRAAGSSAKTRVSRGSAAMADLGSKANPDDPNAPPVPELGGSGRPRRAAAPTTFADREIQLEQKVPMGGPSPSKKAAREAAAANAANAANGGNGDEKVVKKRRTGEKPGRKAKTQQLAQLAAAPSASGTAGGAQQGLQGQQQQQQQAAQQQQQQKPFAAPQPVVKEDPLLLRAQNLEDASLLAGFQSGVSGMRAGHHHVPPPGQGQQPLGGAEGQQQQRLLFNQEGPFVAHMATTSSTADDLERTKGGAAASSSSSNKPTASSYWSVPEQQDFKKYIAHFGTDFVAIASHMGTKTHTMIKNHYQRQVEGGGNSGLEQAAVEANRRRERGEDLGAPPTPTPIIKRKYDQPAGATGVASGAGGAAAGPERVGPPSQRSLAPTQGDPMDTSEDHHGKHGSPPQYANKTRFAPTTAPPIQAHRGVVPSPHTAAATPVQAAAVPHNRPFQPPLGPMHSLRPEVKVERGAPIQGLGSLSGFRPAKGVPGPGTPPGVHSHRGAAGAPAPPNPADPLYLQQLAEEQERARRLTVDHGKDPARGSPGTRPRHSPPPAHDRRTLFDDRAPTGGPPPSSPPRMFQQPPPKVTHPWMSQAVAGAPYPSAASGARTPGEAPSVVKHEIPRPSSVVHPVGGMVGLGGAGAPPQPPAPTPTPGPPKRSNLSSILNSDPDPEPRAAAQPAPLRDVAASAGPTRPASPASAMYGPPTFGSRALDSARRDYAQPPASHLHRPSYPPSSTPAPPPMAGKHEAPPPPQQPQHLPQEREPRPSYLHRSALGGSRANPSPPPYGHSRTPSLTTGPSAPPPPRDHRSMMGQPPHSQPPTTHATPQPVHASLYGMPPQQQQPPPPFSQAPAPELSRAHHAHNASLEGPPRDRYYQDRPEDPYRSRAPPVERERDPYSMHYRQDVPPPREAHMSAAEMDRHRQREHQRAQDQQRQEEQRRLEQRQFEEQRRQQDLDRQRHQEQQHPRQHSGPTQSYGRGPPPPPISSMPGSGPSGYGSPSAAPASMHYGSSSARDDRGSSRPLGGGLRAEAMRESQLVMQQHEAEQQRRLQQQQQDDEHRRRAQQQQGPPPPHAHQQHHYASHPHDGPPQGYLHDPRDRETLDYGRRRGDEPPPPPQQAMYGHGGPPPPSHAHGHAHGRSTPGAYPGQPGGYQPPPGPGSSRR